MLIKIKETGIVKSLEFFDSSKQIDKAESLLQPSTDKWFSYNKEEEIWELESEEDFEDTANDLKYSVFAAKESRSDCCVYINKNVNDITAGKEKFNYDCFVVENGLSSYENELYFLNYLKGDRKWSDLIEESMDGDASFPAFSYTQEFWDEISDKEAELNNVTVYDLIDDITYLGAGKNDYAIYQKRERAYSKYDVLAKITFVDGSSFENTFVEVTLREASPLETANGYNLLEHSDACESFKADYNDKLGRFAFDQEQYEQLDAISPEDIKEMGRILDDLEETEDRQSKYPYEVKGEQYPPAMKNLDQFVEGINYLDEPDYMAERNGLESDEELEL